MSTSERELTVDELAAAVGMTVRNVRAYAARGLLPPPRLVGRTGFYGSEHVRRLRLVRDLLGQGYTLGAVEQALEAAPTSRSASTLALQRALMAPWLPEEPRETDVAELAQRAGVEHAPEVLEELARMGIVELLDEGRLRVLDPTLVDVGVQVVRLGVSPQALVRAQRRVIELVEQAAEEYVRMFHDTVWAEFADRGQPADGWVAVQATVQALQPLAAQAVLASFRSAMAAAVAAEIESDLSGSGQ